jgi:hypothetical protein
LGNFYISLYEHHNILMNEQNTGEKKPLYEPLYATQLKRMSVNMT